MELDQHLSDDEKQRLAVSRLMFWCFRLHEQVIRPPQANQELDIYELIAYECNQKCQADYQRRILLDPSSETGDFYLDPTYMDMVLFNIHFTELSINPWGIATHHFIKPEVKTAGVTYFPLPNFLLPTGCLYCGLPLGFERYSDTKASITRHKECYDPWRKNTRETLLQLYKLIDAANDGQPVDPTLLYKEAWVSYTHLAHLYIKPYKPRYTLVEAYQSIPLSSWIAPLCGLAPRQALLQLPCLKPEARQSDIAFSESEVLQKESGAGVILTLPELEKLYVSDP